MTTLAIPHEIRVLDSTGDTKIIFDPDRPDEVATARRTFSDLTAKGYSAFRVQQDGGKGGVMREFDPTAAKVILAPPIAGG